MNQEPEPYDFPLWKHLHDEHGLTLTESELGEIQRLCASTFGKEEMAQHSNDAAKAIMDHVETNLGSVGARYAWEVIIAGIIQDTFAPPPRQF